MSVNSTAMSERDSKMAIASSAFTASIALNPASSTISAARIRSTISSSTTSTFGTSVDPVDVGILFILRGNRKHRGLVVQPALQALLRSLQANSELQRENTRND